MLSAIASDIVDAGSTGGLAEGNTCTESFTAGTSVAEDANPELVDNECSLSRAG